ncbi:hypothetical protein DNH61_14975 [Paenibacillus sambharensis]|uniref:FHA domain-containing protein n=1 Tax=Paenibacillus sambharensis TaxID=1803190 RepID=A0A2W1LKB7_9BACL|nr:DUF6382 domain-containing protein [Paenibacillus sambharensis]PZD94944.1 hypothetical protein DNH61_14975 [Paenibacillus sambharensis]
MEPFIVDFAMQRGHEMIITRNPPMRRDELDEVDLQMLQAESSPRLLPVDWLEVDGGITFRFTITGKRMLSNVLQTKAITMQQYYELLLAVVEAMDDCRHYLLRESCCLLHENMMFMEGERFDGLRLAYIPMKDQAMSEQTSVTARLLTLAVRWVARVPAVDGAGLQQILKLLEQPGMPLSRLRELLLKLIGEPFAAAAAASPTATDSTAKARTSRGQTAAGIASRGYEYGSSQGLHAGASGNPELMGVNGQRGRGQADRKAKAELLDSIFSSPDGDHEAEAVRQGGSSRTSFGADKRVRFEPAAGQEWDNGRMGIQPVVADASHQNADGGGPSGDTARAKWIAAAIAVLACASCWRFLYLDNPSTNQLLLSSGLTLLIAGGLLLAWKRMAGGETDDEEDTMADGVMDSGPLLNGARSSRWSFPEKEESMLQGNWREAEQEKNSQSRMGAANAADRRAGSANSSGNTVYDAYRVEHILEEQSSGMPHTGGGEMPFNMNTAYIGAHADETVLLPQNRSGQSSLDLTAVLPERCLPVLNRSHDKSDTVFPLAAGQWFIGRSSELCQIVDEADGVSRTHIEVSSNSEEGVAVKDLGSRNGSKLNGSPMVPYKLYRLSEGDSLQLAGANGPVYTFRKNG